MTIGILALQGDVREHVNAFADLGVPTATVQRPDELEGLDGIVLPGGESTTLSLLLDSSGLFDPLADMLAGGLPAFGTCAGMVLLSRSILDGRPDQRSFGLLDCSVRRNGYGRQRFSFECEVDCPGVVSALDETGAAGGDDDAPTMHAVFIRAPVVESPGPAVEVLATLGPNQPVVCRQGAVLASSFHPELTADRRLHRLFSAMVGQTVVG